MDEKTILNNQIAIMKALQDSIMFSKARLKALS